MTHLLSLFWSVFEQNLGTNSCSHSSKFTMFPIVFDQILRYTVRVCASVIVFKTNSMFLLEGPHLPANCGSLKRDTGWLSNTQTNSRWATSQVVCSLCAVCVFVCLFCPQSPPSFPPWCSLPHRWLLLLTESGCGGNKWGAAGGDCCCLVFSSLPVIKTRAGFCRLQLRWVLRTLSFQMILSRLPR